MSLMESPVIEDPKPKPKPKPKPNSNSNSNSKTNTNPNLGFPLNSNSNSHSQSHSHSPTFLSHNGFDSSEFPNSDIEMITIQTVTYTSLKDLIPASPQSIMSPTMNSSWYDEIPIKNPLVKHAALAYLQPMSTPPEVGNKGFFGRLKEKCLCGNGFGCFGWVREVVMRIKEALFETRWIENDEDDEEEEEEEDDEKVD